MSGTRVSRIVKAPRRSIYQAFMDPRDLVAWLPPKGMTGHVYEFDAREGGGYRMSLTFERTEHLTQGKTSEHSDVVRVTFVELVPAERIVELVEFESTDPAYAGAMTIVWTLTDVQDGTEVTVTSENDPSGIRREDHMAGMKSTLENLAGFLE